MRIRAEIALALACALVWSCSAEYGDDEPAVSPADAGVDGAVVGAVDAANDADSSVEAPCPIGAPFGALVPVDGINTVGEELSVALSADELAVFVARVVPGSTTSTDLFFASRSSRNVPFVEAGRMQSINSEATEDNPSTSADGLTLFFFSNRAGLGGHDIYRARRGVTETAFGVPEPLESVNTASNDWDPYYVDRSKTLYFLSDRTGRRDFYVSSQRDGRFDAPSLEPTAGAFAADAGLKIGQPVVSADALELFFLVTDPINETTHVWRSSRLAVESELGQPSRVVLGAEGDIEAPLWISPDRCRLYVRTNRPGGQGSVDIWMASRR